jgi:hypothetical protein
MNEEKEMKQKFGAACQLQPPPGFRVGLLVYLLFGDVVYCRYSM